MAAFINLKCLHPYSEQLVANFWDGIITIFSTQEYFYPRLASARPSPGLRNK